MSDMDVHYSQKSYEWGTPQDFFDRYHAEFSFDLDVCATPENAKCRDFFSESDDGLAQDWSGRICWMNPPYGRSIPKWVEKAYRESLRGATVVCLLPARTDTRWFHEWCAKGEVRFVKGRLKFNGVKDSAPFPNMVVIFRPSGLVSVRAA